MGNQTNIIKRPCLLTFTFDQTLEKKADYIFPENECSKIISIKLADLQDLIQTFKTPFYSQSKESQDANMKNVSNNRVATDNSINILYVLTDTNLYILAHETLTHRFQQIQKIDWKLSNPELSLIRFSEFALYKNAIFLTNFEEEPVVLKICFGKDTLGKNHKNKQIKIHSQNIVDDVKVMKLNLKGI